MKLETKANWALILSVASLVIIVVIIGLWYFKSKEIAVVTLDTFIGVIVALLAIIVTLVLGWQIFNIFELKNKIDEVNELKKQFNEQQNNIQQLTLKNKHITGFTWGKSAVKDNDWTGAFRFLIISLSASLQLDSPINIDGIFIFLRIISQNIKPNTKYTNDCYQEIVKADKEIRSLHNFSLIEERYKESYDNIIAKIEIDDDQK